jgi:4-amino-4-deoxy-L-arabinose transferase-like glycosyltransferase
MLVLAFGQLVVAEVFRDMGIKGLDDPVDFFYYLFPIGLFFFVFYLPIRYIYTVEDFTFARSRWEKVEQVVSFLLVFVGFLIAG